MNQLMFSKTSGADFPTHLKIMVSGPPKSGKTTLTGTVPNILVLDTEPHANNLQSIAHLDLPYKTIYSTDDLRQTAFILGNEGLRKQAATALSMPDIEAVSIDTLDTLQGIMKRERMREQRSNKFLRDDWGWLKEEMVSILEAYLALPMHVIFTVHTKTKDVGTEDNPKTIVLPGLEGSIAESIAGMVGYSLLSFRKEEIKPDGSGKYTKYWLRAEGDETYEYLGNRTAGRLPDVIEPDFNTLLKAAMAGRPQTIAAPQVPVQMQIQTTGQMQQPPAQSAPQGVQQPTPAQQGGQPIQQQQASGFQAPEVLAEQSVAQPSGQPQQAQPPVQQQSAPTQDPQALPADTEPVNAAALTHVKRVYDACGLAFPEEKVKTLNLGAARQIVMQFKGAQEDHAAGKTQETPIAFMIDFLTSQNLLPDADAPAEKAVEPKVDGTMDEVKAYVGDDLARAQEAYNLETAEGGKNRKGMVEWLESKGVQPGAPTPEQPAAAPVAQPVEQVQTPVETPVETPLATPAPQAPSEDQTGVTPDVRTADGTTPEEAAVQTLETGLGATVIGEEINANAKCQVCGNTIDDVDLAQLGKSRFQKILCVKDYIAETKK